MYWYTVYLHNKIVSIINMLVTIPVHRREGITIFYLNVSNTVIKENHLDPKLFQRLRYKTNVSLKTHDSWKGQTSFGDNLIYMHVNIYINVLTSSKRCTMPRIKNKRLDGLDLAAIFKSLRASLKCWRAM